MNEQEAVCQNCAYAVTRTDKTKFKWCDYECTYEQEDSPILSRVPYHYGTDSCSHYLKQDKGSDYQ